ncbi:MAG: AraC family transcriptional regulator [Lachnospiraceae bacterium]|nr:AraC family transcriptional regulator [Lachnospiraceae bacterium]
MFSYHKLIPQFDIDSLINASSYHMTPKFEGFGESHNFWELVYCDKGEVLVQAADNHRILKAGEMVFHCPNEWHDLRCSGSKPADAIILAFTCESPYMSMFEQKVLFLGPREKECLRSIVEESEASYAYFDIDPPYVNLSRKDNAPFASDQVIKSQLELLLIYIARGNQEMLTSPYEISTNIMHQHERLAEEAKEYMQMHLNEKVSLKDIASSLGISISLLKRVFREQSGSSVISYLTNMKISEAKRLIRSNAMNFTQISESLGYDNIHYFSSQFKKQTGMTPTEYARSVRK